MSSAHAHCVATLSAEVCLQLFSCLLILMNYRLIEIILLLLLLLLPHLIVVVVFFPSWYFLSLLLHFEF